MCELVTQIKEKAKFRFIMISDYSHCYVQKFKEMSALNTTTCTMR